MDDKQLSPTEGLENSLIELLRNYQSQSISEVNYPRLTDAMWGEADLWDREFMQRALSEPPEAGSVFAPQDLLLILKIEFKLLEAMEPTLALSERKHLTQMRMAICYSLSASTPRRKRLKAAFNQLLKAKSGNSLSDIKARRMWIAEIAYRLSKELAEDEDPKYLAELAKSGRKAVLYLASHCRSIAELLILVRQFCDLTFRLGEPLHGSTEWKAWKSSFQRSLGMFQIDTTIAHTANPIAEQKELVRDILHLVCAAVFRNSAVLSVWLKQNPEMQSHWNRLLTNADDVQELFQTLLVIARAHAKNGNTVDRDLHQILGVLRETELSIQMHHAHLQQANSIKLIDDLRESIQLRGKDELTLEEQNRLKELKARADARFLPQFAIDPSALSETIDNLLLPQARRGLALSGGGFRAACFHLGVIAALADRDMLRRVDMLSCVSGGAIAGAAYAVRLKGLHASKHDLEITVDDYKKVVSDLIDVFIIVTGMNLRATAFKSPRAIWKMWSRPNYTFSERIADLIDDHLFAPLVASNPKYWGINETKLKELRLAGVNYSSPFKLPLWNILPGNDPIWPLTAWDLTQAPRGEPTHFKLDSDRNRTRESRIPELFINTTILNTGGGYIFSSSGSGEPINELRGEISSRPTFHWRDYDSISAAGNIAPETFRISRIVAASASVPGLLAPILFQRTGQEAVLALSDGGVCDNQGFNPLFSNGCNWILASDAAGQLNFQAYPGVANIEVMVHSTDILMERVREQSYLMAQKIAAARPTIKFTALHLTSGLADSLPQSIFDTDERLMDMKRMPRSTTEFGVDLECQRLLANVRTDLDCHSEAEALSLMAGGYLQASYAVDKGDSSFADSAQVWRFGKLISKLEKFEHERDLASILGAAQYRVLRLPRLVAARLGLTTTAQRVGLAAFYFTVFSLAGIVVFAGPASGAIGYALRWLVLYLLAAILIHKLPPTSVKRWLWKLASGPFLLVAMLYSWVVIYGTDNLYRRLCRIK